MTDTTPADQLRAAAALLREAASHATPGPWRTHDTHLGGVGGHTATVLTDRPNLNDTELIAWLPTMSHEPWDEARNAWRNAGWMALMDPAVGLALADWLDALADMAAAYPQMAHDHDRPACDDYACDVMGRGITLARQILGTPNTNTEATHAGNARNRIADALAAADGWEWAPGFDKTRSPSYQGYLRQAVAVLAVLPAPVVDRATVLRELEARYRANAADSVHPTFKAAYAAVANDLSRLADEAQQPETAVTEEPTPARPVSPADEAHAWNAAHPIGTPVRVWTGFREGDGTLTRTRSRASVLGDHTAVVWVDGEGSCISLSHVDPAPATEEPK